MGKKKWIYRIDFIYFPWKSCFCLFSILKGDEGGAVAALSGLFLIEKTFLTRSSFRKAKAQQSEN